MKRPVDTMSSDSGRGGVGSQAREQCLQLPRACSVLLFRLLPEALQQFLALLPGSSFLHLVDFFTGSTQSGCGRLKSMTMIVRLKSMSVRLHEPVLLTKSMWSVRLHEPVLLTTRTGTAIRLLQATVGLIEFPQELFQMNSDIRIRLRFLLDDRFRGLSPRTPTFTHCWISPYTWADYQRSRHTWEQLASTPT